MFGRKSSGRRARRGAFSGSSLRNAALAGAGMLAWKWWRNRQATDRAHSSTSPSGSGSTSSQSTWS